MLDNGGTYPSRVELARKQTKPRFVEDDFLPAVEIFLEDVTILENHCPLFVNFGINVGFFAQLFQLIHLQFSLRSRLIHIKVELIDGPTGFLLKFHRKMASFPLDQSVQRHSNWGFECCVVSPQCIDQSVGRNFVTRVYYSLQNSLDFMI